MRRLGVIAAVVAAVASLAGAAHAAGQAPIKLIEAGGARFPDRSYVVSLSQGHALTTRNVHVTENGAPVTGLAVIPADAAKQRQLGVVLAIDTSESMYGRPIVNALEAARTFVQHRNPNQQLAIVTFDGTVRVIQPFTTDSAAILRSLSRVPQLGHGTHLYDAVGKAVALIRDAHVEAGSMVVLTDGADVGSSASLASVQAQIATQHVRVFSVGLVSKTFNRTVLEALAGASGGSYQEAGTSSDLESIFDRLGYRLAGDYLIAYRSLASPGRRMHVVVSVDGVPGAVAADYVTPALGSQPGGIYHRSIVSSLLSSSLVLALLVLLAALFVAAIVVWILRPRSRTGVRTRVGAFVSIDRRDRKAKRSSMLSDELLAGAERSLSQLTWWDRYATSLDIAGVGAPPLQILLGTGLATVAAMVLFSLVLGPLGILPALGIPMIVYSYIRSRLDRVRTRFAEQLPDNLEVLAAALRAGHSLVGALSAVVEAAPEPSRAEFQRVIADEQLGASLEEALNVVIVRMANRDLDQVAIVARLQQETGSSSAEVLERVVDTVRSRMELRRLVSTLTAQGRISRWILTLIPVGLALILSVLSPGYLTPLFDHGLGKAMLVAASVMVIAGSLVIKKIVNIKV
ncbi:MAG TPA: VWA domain-containing protein [Gaiellaceae bacterium]